MAEQKTEQPTPKRLREARRRGEVPRSRDVATVAVLLGTAAGLALGARPALSSLAGAPFGPVATRRASLGTTCTHRGKRPTYQPCRVVREEASTGRAVVEPLDWKGSADLATLARADCLAALPEGDYELVAGEDVAVVLL